MGNILFLICANCAREASSGKTVGSFGGPKLALLGGKIRSVSSGGMEKSLLGMGMGYGPCGVS